MATDTPTGSAVITNVTQSERVEITTGGPGHPLTVGDILRVAEAIKSYGHIPLSTRVNASDNRMSIVHERRISNEQA